MTTMPPPAGNRAAAPVPVNQSSSLTGAMPPATAERMAQLPPSVFAWLDQLKAAARASGRQLLDLGIGSPDRPMPAPIVEALRAAVALPETHGYPAYRGTARFREAGAHYMERRFGVHLDPERELLPASGAEEAFTHLSLAYLDASSVALVPGIHYPVHERGPLLAGARVHLLPVQQASAYLPDFAAVPGDVLARARVLILNYPHNPTGAVAPPAFFERAVEFCRQHRLLLISDLAYSELTFDGYRAPSILEIPGAADVAIEVHSFSKSFNMAGLRLAFVVGAAPLLEPLFRLRTSCSYGVPTAIQHAGAFALDHAAALTPAVADTYRLRRDAVFDCVSALGWAALPPRATMFAWLPLPCGFDSQSWSRHLLDTTGIVVTPGNAFGPDGEGYFRISLVADAAVLRQAMHRIGAAANR